MRAFTHILLLLCLAIQAPSLDWSPARCMAGFSAQGREFCRQACQLDRQALASRGANAADLRQEKTCGDFSLRQAPEALLLRAQAHAAAPASQACLAPSPRTILQDAPCSLMAALPQAAGLPETPGLRLPFAQAPPA
jgi:hypothetical protein